MDRHELNYTAREWQKIRERSDLERRARRQPSCLAMLLIVFVSTGLGQVLLQAGAGGHNDAVGVVGALIGLAVGFGLTRLYAQSVEADREEAVRQLRAQREGGCTLGVLSFALVAVRLGRLFYHS